MFCSVFWICSCGCFLRNSAHNTPVIEGLLLCCRLFSTRTFSGTQAPSLRSVEDSFHFRFPSRGEPEAACRLPRDGDGFRRLAARGTAVHEEHLVGGWGYSFFFFSFFFFEEVAKG